MEIIPCIISMFNDCTQISGKRYIEIAHFVWVLHNILKHTICGFRSRWAETLRLFRSIPDSCKVGLTWFLGPASARDHWEFAQGTPLGKLGG